MSCGISHTFSRLPHAILRPPTQAISPYGIAVFPYGHTPDASPHTSRPFSHSHGQIPHSQAISPYDSQVFLKLAFLSTRPAGPVPQIPTNIVKQTSRTCVTPPQTKRRPVQVQQMLQTCDWGGGCRHLLHGYAHTCTYGHAHTFMGTLTAMVTRARSLTCTAMVIHSRACARPRQRPGTLSDETSVRLTQIKRQPSSLKCPAAA